MTTESARRSALVLAPHPDDEAIGCGATILHKRAAGTPVRVVVATDGRYSHRSDRVSPDELARLRAEESVAACDLLGVGADDVAFLGFEEGSLADRQVELVTALVDVIAAFDPDDVLVTCRLDWHPDHQALAIAAETAIVKSGGRARLLEFPVWYWADGPWLPPAADQPVWRALARFVAAPFRPAPSRPELVAIGDLRDRKRAALLTYRTQTTNVTGEPSWAVFDAQFLAGFLGDVEVFFPIEVSQ